MHIINRKMFSFKQIDSPTCSNNYFGFLTDLHVVEISLTSMPLTSTPQNFVLYLSFTLTYLRPLLTSSTEILITEY